MAKNTTLKTRIQNRHDTEANWTTASNATNPFIPLKGEVIVYDPDTTHTTPRVKIGDGVTKVGNLAFVGGDISKFVTTNTAQAIDGAKSFTSDVEISVEPGDGLSVGTILSKDGNIQLSGSIGRLTIEQDSIKFDSYGEGTSVTTLKFTDGGAATLEIPSTKSGTLALTSDIPTNYVTTDTEQTISGIKTFTGNVNFKGMTQCDGARITSGSNLTFIKNSSIEGALSAGDLTDNTVWTLPSSSGELALKSDIPDPITNYVTTSTTQTISGVKTFSVPLNVGLNSSSGTFIQYDSINFKPSSNINGKLGHEPITTDTEWKLPAKSGTIALTDDISSVDPDSLLSVIEGSNGLSVSKNTAGDKVVIQPSDPISLSLGNSAGITMGFTVKNANFVQQYARMGYAGIDIYTNSVARKVIRYNKIQDIDGNGTHDYVREDKLKTINGNSLYGSGDISVGDNETKVQFGDAIQGSQLIPPGYNTVVSTSSSNLQDKAITALWVGVYDGSIGHEYQIPLQDLYNYRYSSSSAAGNFSFDLYSGGQVSVSISKTSNSNITTSYNNGTLNYSIPVTIVNPAGTGTVLLGFVYKGNVFSGSGSY